MCDCTEYELEELAVDTKAKEPVKVAMPIQVVSSRKK